MRIFEALKQYFENGAAIAPQVRDLITSLGLARGARVLEFTSGHRRVTRHLKDLNLVACDIHPEVVSFCADVLGVKCIPSAGAKTGGRKRDLISYHFAVVSLSGQFVPALVVFGLRRAQPRWLFDVFDAWGKCVYGSTIVLLPYVVKGIYDATKARTVVELAR